MKLTQKSAHATHATMGSRDPVDMRETKFIATDIETTTLDGSFSGYASVFGQADFGNDVVEKGAFIKSLARRGPGEVRMLFQHNPEEPIGIWQTIEETPHGLRVEGRITRSTIKGREVLALMREKAIDGLSIGFRTKRALKGHDGSRRIIEADLWEISIVTFPMQENARIESVKSFASAAFSQRPTIREFERWLVRDAGFTRSEARLISAKGYSQLPQRRDAAAAPNALVERIRAATHLINKT